MPHAPRPQLARTAVQKKHSATLFCPWIHAETHLKPFFSAHNGSNIVGCWLDIFIVIFSIALRKRASRGSTEGLIAKHFSSIFDLFDIELFVVGLP
jgi:hypothetical protein